jgi:hypothetical protein
LIAIALLIDHGRSSAAMTARHRSCNRGSGMPIAVNAAKTGKKMWALAAYFAHPFSPRMPLGGGSVFLGELVMTRHMVGTPLR